jgi:hypothetical protein
VKEDDETDDGWQIDWEDASDWAVEIVDTF